MKIIQSLKHFVVLIFFISALIFNPVSISSSFGAAADPLSRDQVPKPLKPWIDWVLHDHEEVQCPVIYNDISRTLCTWPDTLHIRFSREKAVFSQKWEIYQADTRVFLPGSRNLWPQNVTVNNTSCPVGCCDDQPWIQIQTPGKVTVKGELNFDRIPEKIKIPGHTGLVDLSVNNRAVVFPRLDKNGWLWVRQDRDAGSETQAEDSLKINVYRLIKDDIPALVVTRLQVDVSGRHRKERIGTACTDRFVPVRLESPLPAKIEKDGSLVLQVRPGSWTIELTARHKGKLTDLALSHTGRYRKTSQEIWSFKPFNHLRMVDIQGPARIDPNQTTMPDAWKSCPAYRIGLDDTMTFTVKRRGDPYPAPDRLHLDRTLWLDFDGRGFSVADTITGTMTSGWRLSMNDPVALGRVTLNGRQQFITRLGDSDRAGVEMRHGNVNLKAQARINQMGAIPATGWDKTFKSVKGRLNLPPGWSLFCASGMDNIQDTWVKKWTLLDIFLVLVISLAAARLKGIGWGCLSLVTLVLIKHEPGAPVWVWLNLMAAAALLRVIPKGRIRGMVNAFWLGCILFLVVVSLPFMADQAKKGIYPQLEKSWKVLPGQQDATYPAGSRDAMVKNRKMPLMQKELQSLPAPKTMAENISGKQKTGMLEGYYTDQEPVTRVDTSAKIQTGPGIPCWQWNSVSFAWNGPVEKGRTFALVFISPVVTMGLAFVRIVLLGLLIWGFSGAGYIRSQGFDFSALKLQTAGVLLIPILVIMFFLSAPRVSGAANGDTFPPDELLTALKTKLIQKKKPECAPDCATISRMHADLNPETLSIRIEVHSLYDVVAVPLPTDARQWLPSRVTMDNQPVDGIYLDQDMSTVWIKAPKGIHQVDLTGPMPDSNRVQLSLPLKPGRVTATISGWQIDGIRDNGIPENQIQFTRITTDTEQADQRHTFEPERLPPLLSITRTLDLGLEWTVKTVVNRLSPTGFAIAESIPVLPGESVITDIPVKDGQVQVTLDSQQKTLQWQSSLDRTERLELRAPDTLQWTEIWKLNVGTVWHAEMSGIPVIHHQGQSGTWLPEYRPWPGEALVVHITRPRGIEGQTHTIEAIQLDLTPGKRITDAELKLDITSSRGGRHDIRLPGSAELQSVRINGKSQPIRQQGDKVSLPLTPGRQTIELNWHEMRKMRWLWRTSDVDLAMPGVDCVLTARVPKDRWVLFCAGPYVGPAVLFWSAVLVIIILSAGLSRVKTVPLRFYHWVLLGIGLIQASMLTALPVAAWLLVLGARKQYGEKQSNTVFNAVQILIPVLTLAAVAALFYGIQHGLLGYPDMQIAGNGSHNHFLRWYQDMAASHLPAAFVVSVPILVYRLLILAWSLWIAFSFIRWLRWGFECYSTGGFWRPVSLRFPAGRKRKNAPDDSSRESDEQ
ncbi:MAG: hypothetical protein R6U68_08650 [Desulfobacteraceae bacterium]